MIEVLMALVAAIYLFWPLDQEASSAKEDFVDESKTDKLREFEAEYEAGRMDKDIFESLKKE